MANILKMGKTTKWSNVCKKKWIKIIATMPKVTKISVVVFKRRVNFNRFTVVEDIFSS